MNSSINWPESIVIYIHLGFEFQYSEIAQFREIGFYGDALFIKSSETDIFQLGEIGDMGRGTLSYSNRQPDNVNLPEIPEVYFQLYS